MPSGVYKRTPEHRAARLARNRMKREKKNGAGNGRDAVSVARQRMARPVLSLAVKEIEETTKKGEFDLAREWLSIAEMFRPLTNLDEPRSAEEVILGRS